MWMPTSKTDLETLITSQVQESIHLDYKDTRALQGNGPLAELSKDVSAFANSDGGLLVYGVIERNHLPTAIDGGVRNDDMPKERLEQLIASNIAPRIDGLVIQRIPVSEANSAFAILVPKSYRAPHQDRVSKKYYKRFNYMSQPMEDYEVADVRARSRAIVPLVSLDVEVQHNALFFFVITNPGDAAAQDVRFSFSEALTWDKEEPALIKKGIKLLPPRREFRLLYGVTYEVFDPAKNRRTQFDASITYYHPAVQQEVTETTSIDLQDYLGTSPPQVPIDDLADKLQKSLSELRAEVRSVGDKLLALAPLASATGLQLSAPSLRALAKSFEREPQLERLSPLGRSPAFFEELLGVDRTLARRLSSHFRGDHEQPLESVAGVSQELLAAMRQSLRIDSND